MAKNIDRYKSWFDGGSQSISAGDVDTYVSFWADGCTYLAVDPFDESETVHGLTGIRQLAEAWSTNASDFRLLKSEILSAGPERGIGNARVTWTDKGGKTWACDFIFQVTLDSSDRCTSYKEWNVVRSKT